MAGGAASPHGESVMPLLAALMVAMTTIMTPPLLAWRLR